MDLIYTNSQMQELGFLKEYELDLEVGKQGESTNDYELTIKTGSIPEGLDYGSLVYYEGTEYGGIVERKKVSTSDETITFMGPTFRGLLEKEYVQPPEGQTHLKAKGEANKVINSIIAGRFGDLLVVDEIGSSGINVNYDIRDMNLLKALENTLKAKNAKLDIKHQQDGKVHLKAVQINDISDLVQYDNSYQVAMLVETKIKPYNHILALGKGELLNRLRVNLYLQEDGTWSTTEANPGLERKTFKYEDTNTEDAQQLQEAAIKKAEEANGTDTLEVSFDADNAELYDVVAVKEEITGVAFKTQITEKILKFKNNIFDISYKVGESK